MIYLVHLYCDSLCLLQVKLYEGKLLTIMTCALVSVMLLVRILFIDTSLHKSMVLFTEFSFRLGTSEVSAWGGWYVHFASLFYIVIYCYSLYISYLEMILMLFPVFLHVWWLLESLLPESRFCWKKDRQDTIFLKISNYKKIPRNSYFIERWK
jgi:hypothetical protein